MWGQRVSRLRGFSNLGEFWTEIQSVGLGPLDLNLLGLQIHLDKIVLDITAQSAPGNLLGNLLCDVAALLNTSPTQTLVNLLNQIVAILKTV
jgi:hypothetical protein